MLEAFWKKIKRVRPPSPQKQARPPRVHITYDVDLSVATEVKELPFVLAIFADLSGQPTEPLPELKDRGFVEITPDNFDSVLDSLKPYLSLEVNDKLSEESDAGKIRVDLHFKSLKDFDPANVAKNVKPLKELLELRRKLADLRGALQGNSKLDDLLMEAVGNTQKAKQLKKELEQEKRASGA